MEVSHTIILVLLLVISTNADDEYTAPLKREKREASSKKKLRVVTILNEPYTMKVNQSHFDGYKGYRGLIPDFLRELEEVTPYEFELYLVDDGKYGSRNENGTWNGMIGEVIKKEKGDITGADIAAAPLTITSAREEVVDFLKPFQHTGLSMLIKRPGPMPSIEDWHETFTVIKPLTAGVWVAVTAGLLLVILILWGNNRINPYEWGGRHNLGRASEAAAEQFSLAGSAWFAFTTLQWQGFEKAPRSLSSRTLTIFWFVFVTLTLLTYTGSLINVLFWSSTVHGPHHSTPPIQNLRDLVLNKKYDYGFIVGGSTSRYFMQVADGPIFQQMRDYWSTDKGIKALVSSVDEGVKKVRSEKYVLFGETISFKYLVGKEPCDLMVVGESLGTRSYGMAVPQNMDREILEELHRAILEEIEEGDIAAMESKWWREETMCWLRNSAEEIAKLSALYLDTPHVVSLDVFMGPLLILFAGIILSILVGIGEIIFYKQRGRYQRSNRQGGDRLQLDDDTSS